MSGQTHKQTNTHADIHTKHFIYIDVPRIPNSLHPKQDWIHSATFAQRSSMKLCDRQTEARNHQSQIHNSLHQNHGTEAKIQYNQNYYTNRLMSKTETADVMLLAMVLTRTSGTMATHECRLTSSYQRHETQESCGKCRSPLPVAHWQYQTLP